ncbi:Hypothetical protein A7982_00189 [Minicystis rosea]|nr:Hypothetical protein A7982_00189 [Minicystis rosea]
MAVALLGGALFHAACTSPVDTPNEDVEPAERTAEAHQEFAPAVAAALIAAAAAIAAAIVSGQQHPQQPIYICPPPPNPHPDEAPRLPDPSAPSRWLDEPASLGDSHG